MNTVVRLLDVATKTLGDLTNVERRTRPENETRGVAEVTINRDISSILDTMTIAVESVQHSADQINTLQQSIQCLNALLNLK